MPRGMRTSWQRNWLGRTTHSVVCLLVAVGCGARSEIDAPRGMVTQEDVSQFVGRWRGRGTWIAVDLSCEVDPLMPNARWNTSESPDAFIRMGAGPGQLLVVNQRLVVESFDDPLARRQTVNLVSARQGIFAPELLGGSGLVGTIRGTIQLDGNELTISACWLEYPPDEPRRGGEAIGFRGVARFRRIE